jgi:hypothetical protein
MTSESGKNASGQEAFGCMVPGTPVVESPAASATDVTSTAARAGTMVAPEVDKAETSAPPTIEGEGGDRGTSDPQLAPGLQGIIDEGTESVNDEDRCLYLGTPWEAVVVTDHNDLETFKEAACMIGIMLLVRTFVDPLRLLLQILEYREI